jgi:hypothetical protein
MAKEEGTSAKYRIGNSSSHPNRNIENKTVPNS